MKKSPRRDRALAAGSSHHEVSVEGEEHRGKVGGRVAVRDGAADGAAVANLRVADLPRGVGDDGALLAQERARRDVVVAGQRADRDPIAVVLDVREVGEPSDVDEKGRLGEAQLHERQQRVPAGQQLRVLALPEQADRVVDGGRNLVVEGGRDHAAPP